MHLLVLYTLPRATCRCKRGKKGNNQWSQAHSKQSKIYISSSQNLLELVGQAKSSPDTKAGLENTSLQLFGKGGNWTGNRQVLWKEQELPERKQGKDTGHNLPPKQEGLRDNSLPDSAMVTWGTITLPHPAPANGWLKSNILCLCSSRMRHLCTGTHSSRKAKQGRFWSPVSFQD